MALGTAIGKLISLAVMVVIFFAGMFGVIFLSLQGNEISVPEITGKNFTESERELAALGLKIKKRADRVSDDPPNTVIEQLPKPGETVKTGQLILVVTSKQSIDGESGPARVKKPIDEDDSDKIEELISDKPKKARSNSNTNRKKADTSRDTTDDNSNSKDSSASTTGNSNKKDGSTDTPGDKQNKDTSTGAGKSSNPPSNTRSPNGDPKPRASNRP